MDKRRRIKKDCEIIGKKGGNISLFLIKVL